MKVLLCSEKKKRSKDPFQIYYVDPNCDFDCEFGRISKDQFENSIVETNTGVKMSCFDSAFVDDFMRLKRGAQVILPKDIGAIITHAGINKSTSVVEGGSGSGWLACYLASVCKKVVSYDVREEHQNTAIKNAKRLDLTNLSFKLESLGDMSEKPDVVIIDIPQPWDVMENISKKLKPGAVVVTYCPTIVQVMKSVEFSSSVNLFHFKTIEMIERTWRVDGRAVRPVADTVGHTAFLSFYRRI